MRFFLAAAMVCLVAFPLHAGEKLSLEPMDSGTNEDAPSSIWTRPSLLDGPGSPKEALRARGIILDAHVTQTYMGVVAGETTRDWQYGGKATIDATFDLAKWGFWRGLSVNVFQEWNYGESVTALGAGQLLPINGIVDFPRSGGYDDDTSITVTQKIGDRFTVGAGKYALLSLVAKTPIVGGGGKDTFLNAAIAGPITGIIPPYIMAVKADLKTDVAAYSLMVYDPRNAQDWDVVSNPYQEQAVSFGITLPTKIAGLTGYYGVRGVYSTLGGTDLSRIPDLVALPPGSSDQLSKDDRWYINVSVQQYLYQDPTRPGVGWGFFGYAGISDGNPNAIETSFFAGFAGNSMIPGREQDLWGVGYFRYGISKDLRDGLDTLGIDIQAEQGIEAYYNIAVTPWFRLTADLQWIDPVRAFRDDIVVTGLRAKTNF